MLLFDPMSRHFVCELRAQFLLCGNARKRGVAPRVGLKHTFFTRCLAGMHGQPDVHWTSSLISISACTKGALPLTT